jgi:hypothetical protein
MAIDRLSTGSQDDEWQLTTPSALSSTSQSHSPAFLSISEDFETISAILSPEKSLADVFAAFGLDLEAEQIRLQLSSSRSLQELYDNHNAGSQILEKLGLAGFRTDPNAKQIYRHTGGLELEAAVVLTQGLAWSTATYSKKSKAFIWAENIHNFKWKDSEPKGVFTAHETLLSFISFSL